MSTRLFPVFFVLVLSAAAAHAQTFSVLYNFGTNPGDPVHQFYSGIIAQGRDGNLYSSAISGGANTAFGATYAVTPAGALTTLYSFATVAGDGGYPYGGLTLGTDGNFYGTTFGGGILSYGTVFKMTPDGTLTTLYTFTDGTDGALPTAPPVEGADGNFYGTTCGACNGATGLGTIYKITPSGTFTVLYQFDNTHGAYPTDPLTLGADGNFYGTAQNGGANGEGVIFKITATGKLTVLYNFDGTHGRVPLGPLVQGTDGNFYGTTGTGGASGVGGVFKMTPAGGLTVLHDMNGTTDGGNPIAGLVQATDGNFYGVNIQYGASSAGCPAGCGTIFRITPAGVFSVLHNFDLTTGEFPYSTLFQHTDGLLYGGTQMGGTGGGSTTCGVGACGVLYSLNISAAPFARMIPTTGTVGETVGVLGQGFTGTTGVSFNGTTASFTVVSDTYLTATVPHGATTGSVAVNTPGGTLTSNVPFRIGLQKATTTKLVSSGSPSTVHQAVTFTATVSSTGGSIPDGEAVTFYDGSLQIGSGVTAAGVATFSTSSLSVRTHTIKATYAGDIPFKTSSGTVVQVVEPYATKTNAASNLNPSNFGQSVTLSAVVTSAGGVIPTGTVTFKNSSTTLGTGKLDAAGKASLVTSKLPVGSNVITASYNGDSQDGKSSSPSLVQTVNHAQITMTLTSSPNPSTSGSTVKFTATLASNGSLPNGQLVTFSNNGGALGTAKIVGGKAIFSTAALPVGSNQITASYAGDSNYSSAEAAVTQTVH